MAGTDCARYLPTFLLMRKNMHISRCVCLHRRLAKAAGLSLGLAMAASIIADPTKITSQPTDLSAEEGTAASLSVGVSSSPNTYR